MHIEYFLYFLLVIFGIVIICYGDKYISQKTRIKILEKRLSNNMTDFEKLSHVVEVIKNVDENKLNEDELKMWIDFLCEYLSGDL